MRDIFSFCKLLVFFGYLVYDMYWGIVLLYEEIVKILLRVWLGKNIMGDIIVYVVENL